MTVVWTQEELLQHTLRRTPGPIELQLVDDHEFRSNKTRFVMTMGDRVLLDEHVDRRKQIDDPDYLQKLAYEQIQKVVDERLEDLPWEDYLWPPKKKRYTITNYDANGNMMTAQEVRDAIFGRKTNGIDS